MNPIIPVFVIALIFIVITPFFKTFEYREFRENAEFEAKNCPEMLRVDSKYCKAIEGE